jgi:hypothetical protein
MDHQLAKLAAAGAVVGILGIGGATLASAQDSTSSSTSTTVRSSTQDDSGTRAPDAAKDGKDCPLHDQAADDTSADASDSAS